MQRNLRANKDSLYSMRAICSSLPETSTTLLININILGLILATRNQAPPNTCVGLILHVLLNEQAY